MYGRGKKPTTPRTQNKINNFINLFILKIKKEKLKIEMLGHFLKKKKKTKERKMID